MAPLVPTASPIPRLPSSGARGRVLSVACAALLHGALAAGGLASSRGAAVSPASGIGRPDDPVTPADVTSIVFLLPHIDGPAAGGGGGGNRQAAPIRHASGVGTDAITIRVRTPEAPGNAPSTLPEALPALVLDAKPLASGTFDQVGLPAGGVSFGDSTGPGSGGGVGSGAGTGIGSGRGPGMGPGEGGGIGGGVYQPGGLVTPPRVISNVQPNYTPDALEHGLQGTVVLTIVVRRDGCASDIRVVRSLDPGLDEQAALAVAQWRFAPGRFSGSPVDVAATVIVDFTIR